MSIPDPADIRAAREAAGLSQTAAADLVHSKLRTWQQWEAGDRKMHPGLWELFRRSCCNPCPLISECHSPSKGHSQADLDAWRDRVNVLAEQQPTPPRALA